MRAGLERREGKFEEFRAGQREEWWGTKADGKEENGEGGVKGEAGAEGRVDDGVELRTERDGEEKVSQKVDGGIDGDGSDEQDGKEMKDGNVDHGAEEKRGEIDGAEHEAVKLREESMDRGVEREEEKSGSGGAEIQDSEAEE